MPLVVADAPQKATWTGAQRSECNGLAGKEGGRWQSKIKEELARVEEEYGNGPRNCGIRGSSSLPNELSAYPVSIIPSHKGAVAEAVARGAKGCRWPASSCDVGRENMRETCRYGDTGLLCLQPVVQC